MKKLIIFAFILFCYSLAFAEDNKNSFMRNNQNQSNKRFIQMSAYDSAGSFHLSQVFRQQEKLLVYPHNGKQATESEKSVIARIIKDDFQVNDEINVVAGHSVSLSMVMGSNGNFVIACQNFCHEGWNYGICYQRYDPSGIAQGCYTKVNEDEMSGFSPNIAMDGEGNFVIVWQGIRNDSYDIYFQRYNVSGYPLGGNVKVNTGVANFVDPAIAMNENGNFVIAWADDINGNVFCQRYNTAGMAQGGNVQVNNAVNAWYAVVAMDESGKFVIGWTTNRDNYGDIYYQQYDSIGAAQGGNIKVNNGAQAWSSSAVDMDWRGNFVIVWGDYYGDVFFQRYNSAGVALGGNVKVNDDTGTAAQQFPDVAMYNSGGFDISWTDSRKQIPGTNYDIYSQRYDSSGVALGTNYKVNDEPGHPLGPGMLSSIAVSENGNYVIGWNDYRHGWTNPYLYYQCYDSTGYAQGTNRYVRDGQGTTVAQHSPDVARDGKGNFLIVWQHNLPFSDIYFQRYDSTGVALGGNTGASNTVPFFTSQWSPEVAMNPSGSFVIGWADSRIYDNPDIYFQRYDSSAVAQGLNQNANDDPGTALQNSPSVAIDINSDFILVWEDYRNGDPDIYYQQYNSAGIPQGPNIKANDDLGTADQEYPSVITDENGGFIIVWQDKRDGNSNIYYQIYNSSGVAQGVNKKVNDDSGSADQMHPSIAADENGNFIIVWEDWRNGNPDIYFQLYNSSGVAQGNNVKSNDDIGTTWQRLPKVDINGEGKFVIVWEDYRFGWDNPDILGQRYYSDGAPWGENYRIVTNGPNFGEKAPAVSTTSGAIIFSWIDNRDSTDGNWNVFGKIATWDWDGAVSVKEQAGGHARKPQNFALSQNYPNPFNPSTTIEFDLPKTSEVSLKVFNILGEEVATLVSDRLSAGSYFYEWDASGLASGIYLYRLQASDYVETRKMVLMR